MSCVEVPEPVKRLLEELSDGQEMPANGLNARAYRQRHRHEATASGSHAKDQKLADPTRGLR